MLLLWHPASSQQCANLPKSDRVCCYSLRPTSQGPFDDDDDDDIDDNCSAYDLELDLGGDLDFNLVLDQAEQPTPSTTR